MKYKYLLFVLIFSTTMAYSQNKPWKTQGNNVDNSEFIGTKNNKPLKFKTNNQLRMKIKKDGDILVKDSMHIEGGLNVDNYINVDSIHARSIRVGDHSLWIGGNPYTSPTWGTSDMISSDNGNIGFYNQNGFPTSNLQTLSDIKLSIGGLPLYKLSINDFGNNAVYTSYTNATVNSGLGGVFPQYTDGFLVGITANGDAMLNQQEDGDIIFNAGIVNKERMRIVGADFWAPGPINATVRNGNVGIATSNPLTKLHIGGDNSSDAGWRDWMDIGTLYSSDSNYFDNMYVGLRRRDDSNYDRNEAIINWGNNPVGNADFDRLRFVFTAATSLGIPASGADGLEVSRMISDGWNSRMGIGNFFTTNTDPKRQLDIYDDGLTAGGNPIANGRPQLRLTQTLAPSVNAGIFTDFQTTGTNNNYEANNAGPGGHLLINPRNSSDVNVNQRIVAINFES